MAQVAVFGKFSETPPLWVYIEYKKWPPAALYTIHTIIIYTIYMCNMVYYIIYMVLPVYVTV